MYALPESQAVRQARAKYAGLTRLLNRTPDDTDLADRRRAAREAYVNLRTEHLLTAAKDEAARMAAA